MDGRSTGEPAEPVPPIEDVLDVIELGAVADGINAQLDRERAAGTLTKDRLRELIAALYRGLEPFGGREVTSEDELVEVI